MCEKATVHAAGDCILGLCEHPSHYLEDAVVDVFLLMGEQAFSDPEVCVPEFDPVFL